jgi:antitoxin component of MazEF toxin-antitoxin module
MEEFISTVSIQKQKGSSFMISIPSRITKRLMITPQQEAKVSVDGNKIIYEVVVSEEKKRKEEERLRIEEEERIKQELSSRSCKKIIKAHHDKMKDDPERLTSKFLVEMTGCDCKKNTDNGESNE